MRLAERYLGGGVGYRKNPTKKNEGTEENSQGGENHLERH